MEGDKFEEDELGNYSIDVLLLAVQGTDLQLPSQFIIWEKGYGFNQFFALHGVPGDKWLLKDSLKMAPYMN
eukprot:14026657-Ditylum_brightwellii.AAC.1